jgi:hypothetical protein
MFALKPEAVLFHDGKVTDERDSGMIPNANPG